MQPTTSSFTRAALSPTSIASIGLPSLERPITSTRRALDPGAGVTTTQPSSASRTTSRVTSLLAQRLAEGNPPNRPRGNGSRGDGAECSSAAKRGEKEPGHGEVVRRRVEDVLQHRDEHFREQPAEHRREREGRGEYKRKLGPHERCDVVQRGAEHRHRCELLPALRETDRREEHHRRRSEQKRERLFDAADSMQVHVRDRADSLHRLLLDVLHARPRRSSRVRDTLRRRHWIAAWLDKDDVRAW